MPAAADHETSEAERVLIHRIDRFFDLGLTYPEALELALSHADLHKAQDMADEGCTPELLIRILL